MARPRTEPAVVVQLSTYLSAVITRSGIHLLRSREVLGFLTAREATKLAEAWLAESDPKPENVRDEG